MKVFIAGKRSFPFNPDGFWLNTVQLNTELHQGLQHGGVELFFLGQFPAVLSVP